MKHSIHPIILKIWQYQKKCCSYHFSSMIVLRKYGITPFLFSLMISTSSNWTSVLGKSSSFCSNQEGHSHHLEQNKAFPEHTWDGKLVELRSSWTFPHPFFIVRLRNHLHTIVDKCPPVTGHENTIGSKILWTVDKVFLSHDTLIMFYQSFHITE